VTSDLPGIRKTLISTKQTVAEAFYRLCMAQTASGGVRGTGGAARSIATELDPDALTVRAGVSYDSTFEGVETKGLSRGRGSPYCVARRVGHGGQWPTERGCMSVLQPSATDDRRDRSINAHLV
jgi:hypothetical protein